MKTFEKEFDKNFPNKKLISEEKHNCSEKRCKSPAEYSQNNNNICRKHFDKVKKNL